MLLPRASAIETTIGKRPKDLKSFKRAADGPINAASRFD
jgi:hypothetical protein